MVSNTILAGWLIDGSGGSIQKNILLSFNDDSIISLTPATFKKSSTQKALDLTHCTILPALIDAHVHLFMSGTSDPEVRKSQLSECYKNIKPVIRNHIDQHLAYGVCAIRDGGDSQSHVLKFKTESRNKLPIRIKAAGRAWHKQGRYGSLIGRCPEEGYSLAQAIESDSEKPDHIKIVNSGLNSLTDFGRETAFQFNKEEMTAAIKSAQKRRLKVMVHANGKEPVKISLEAGCFSIEHGFFMGKDNLDMMADLQIFWVPTVGTMKAYAEQLIPGSQEADIAKKNLDDQLEQIRFAKAYGVPIAMGTDAGSLGVNHGSGVIQELKLLIQAGYSIQEAVRCACFNGASLLNLKNFGHLKSEMSASFIAVKGDPSNLPESLASIECFYINGNAVKPYQKPL